MFRTEFDEEEKLWKGRSSAIPFHADSSLGHIVLDAMKSNGSRCAQVTKVFLYILFNKKNCWKK